MDISEFRSVKMNKFNPDEYGANVRFRRKKVQVHTFFVAEGFDLNPFPRNKRPWINTGSTNEDGNDIYVTTAVIDFILPDGRVCRVPRNFQWDGASIPRWARWFIGQPMGKYALAALLHDWLYSSRILGDTKNGRQEADELFLTVMEQLDISWWRRKSMYRAVRFGGGYPYHMTDETEHCEELMEFEPKYNPWKDYASFYNAIK